MKEVVLHIVYVLYSRFQPKYYIIKYLKINICKITPSLIIIILVAQAILLFLNLTVGLVQLICGSIIDII